MSDQFLNVFILGRPVPKGRPRFTLAGHAYTPEKTRSQENNLKAIFQAAMDGRKPLTGMVALRILFGFERPKSNKSPSHIQRPDLDNLAKLITDAGNGIIYKDDSQIVSLELSKFWSEKSGVSVVVYGLEGGDI